MVSCRAAADQAGWVDRPHVNTGEGNERYAEKRYEKPVAKFVADTDVVVDCLYEVREF